MIKKEMFLGAKETRGHAIVAVKVDVVKGGGNSIPSWHGGRFGALDTSGAGDDYATVAHGAADENDFEFDLRANGDFFWAKEEYARGADVAGYECHWKVFGEGVHASESQWQF